MMNVEERNRQVDESAVLITQSAREKILETMQQYEGKFVLRIYARPGGCCGGVQMGLALDRKIDEDDVVFDVGDFRVAMDQDSFPLVKGCTVDFDVDEGGFIITNPNLQNPGSCLATGCSGCAYANYC